MDKDKLQKVKEQVDKALLARGIDPSIRELNDKIQSEVKMKEEQELKQGLVDELFNYIDGKLDVDKNMIYEAIKGIKIEPVINTPEIKVPEIKVPEVIVNYTTPDVIVPEIKVPTPIVNVPAPIVNVDIPKTMEVTGFGSFVKAMFEIIKNQITVKLGGIDRDKPLPVILVDEKGIYYKAISNMIASGGGGSIKGLMNIAGTIINPATEDKQDSAITELGNIQDKQDDIIDELQDIEAVVLAGDAGTKTNLASEVTLTTANTAYLLPASEQAGRKIIAIYNKSDYDVFVGGSGVTVDNGMLVEPGDKYFQDSESGVYAVCATASVKINIVESK